MAGRDLVLLARGDPEGDHAPERGQRPQARLEGRRRRSSRAPRRPARRRWPRGSPPEVVGARVDRRVGAEPLRRARASPRSRRARSPARRRAWRAGRRACRCRRRPPATTTVSPGSSRAQRWTSACAVRPWSSSAAAWSSETPSGTGISQRLGHGDVLRVAAGRPGAPRPGGRRRSCPQISPPGDQRQRLLGEVVVAGRVGVGEVDAGARDVDDDLAVAGLGVGQLDELHHLGPAELARSGSLSSRHESVRMPRRGPDRRRIDRLRQRAHPVRGARAHARRLRGALRARGELLHRGPGRRPGRRRLRRRAARGARRARDRHRRHRARRRRRDLLLARPLRPRHERRPHRRHPAQRVRRLRAEALAGIVRGADAVPRQHPARAAARRPRGSRRRASPRSTR